MSAERPELTVLLVQPSEDTLDLYSEYLAAQGVACVTATNAADALAAAPQADLVVTGILLPGTADGVELIAWLRAGEATRRLPIIVLTACATEREHGRATAAGCDAFLVKPCLPSELLAEILRVAAVMRLPPVATKPIKVGGPRRRLDRKGGQG